MYWRIGSAYRKRPREKNKAAFRELVRRGPPPGLLAFDGDVSVGWCQLTPRSALQWLDGANSLHHICREFEAAFPPQRITPQHLQSFFANLYENGLIIALKLAAERTLRNRPLRARQIVGVVCRSGIQVQFEHRSLQRSEGTSPVGKRLVSGCISDK